MRWTHFIAPWVILMAGSLCLAHDGRPDPAPKHGGVVFTSGALDVETVLQKPKGRYQIYFSDAAGQDVPASVVSDVQLTVRHSTGSPEKVIFKVDDVAKTWVASSRSADSSIVAATLSYEFLDIPIRTEIPFSSALHAEFESEPKVAKARQAVQLVFHVKDFFGKSVPSLDIVHEKQIHLMIVSQDLGEFYHIHPEPSPGDVFRVPHTFPYGGNYKLYADYTPVGGTNRIEVFDLKVLGEPRRPIPLGTRGLKTATVDGIKMVLAADRPLRTGEDIGLSMSLFDAKTNAPIHNLQRYLAAWAHIAVVSEDLQDFIHVHPIDEETASAAGSAPSPASIRTATGFRRPGLYKMWVQVQRENKVTAVPFIFRVEAGGSTAVSARVPPGAILVKVSASGFEPSLIPARAGIPLKLAFFRPDAQNCGREVIFPDLGIQRELPVGQTVVIDVTPRKTGSLSFSCGMKMLHGELLVQ